MTKQEENKVNIDLDIMNLLGQLNCKSGEDCYLYVHGNRKDCFIRGEGDNELIINSLVTSMKNSPSFYSILEQSLCTYKMELDK